MSKSKQKTDGGIKRQTCIFKEQNIKKIYIYIFPRSQINGKEETGMRRKENLHALLMGI